MVQEIEKNLLQL